MKLKPLNPEITLKLLEGREDVITPLAEQREQFYQSQVCPNCGSTALKRVGDGRILFRQGEVLPRFQMQCDSCTCVFDPFTNIQLTMGNLGDAFEPTVPLIDGPED